jgi:hypothetical protein
MHIEVMVILNTLVMEGIPNSSRVLSVAKIARIARKPFKVFSVGYQTPKMFAVVILVSLIIDWIVKYI